MNHIQFGNKKLLWIACAVLITIVICGLVVWLGGGMIGMISNHLGL